MRREPGGCGSGQRLPVLLDMQPVVPGQVGLCRFCSFACAQCSVVTGAAHLPAIAQVDLSGEEVQAAFDLLDTGGGGGLGTGVVKCRLCQRCEEIRYSLFRAALTLLPADTSGTLRSREGTRASPSFVLPLSSHQTMTAPLWLPPRCRQERHTGLWGVGGVVAAEEARIRVAGGQQATLF